MSDMKEDFWAVARNMGDSEMHILQRNSTVLEMKLITLKFVDFRSTKANGYSKLFYQLKWKHWHDYRKGKAC